MPVPSLRNETRPRRRANYQSQPLRSQQEMTSGIRVICSGCQRRSASHQIKRKHQLREPSGRNSSKWNPSRAAKRPRMRSTRISLHLIWLLERRWPVFKILSRRHRGCWAVADFTGEPAEYGPRSPIWRGQMEQEPHWGQEGEGLVGALASSYIFTHTHTQLVCDQTRFWQM